VLLEASGHVDGIAGHERLRRGDIACHHLARVHADPHLDRDAAIALEFSVQGG
jgi:hypothetical protein